jgi:predicted DNA-binding ArsR family transcriptional regulator
MESVCKHMINIYEKTWSTIVKNIVKQHGQQSSKHMVNNRQVILSKITINHGQQPSKTHQPCYYCYPNVNQKDSSNLLRHSFFETPRTPITERGRRQRRSLQNPPQGLWPQGVSREESVNSPKHGYHSCYPHEDIVLYQALECLKQWIHGDHEHN